MDEALVENSQHDVDHQDRPCTSSSPSRCSEDWKACAVPWKLVLMVAGRVCRASFCTLADRLAQRDARLRVEGNGHRGQLAQVIDRQRTDASA